MNAASRHNQYYTAGPAAYHAEDSVEKDQMSKALGEMMAHYAPEKFAPSKDGLAKVYGIAWQQIGAYPLAAMLKAMDVIYAANNRLPPIQRIIEEVKKHGAVMREKEAAEEKREYQRGTKQAFGDQTEIARDTCALVQALRSGKIDNATYLDGIRHLDAIYPRAGFAAAGVDLQRRSEQHGGRFVAPVEGWE